VEKEAENQNQKGRKKADVEKSYTEKVEQDQRKKKRRQLLRTKRG